MKYIRKFNSIEEMRAAIAADEVGFVGMVHPKDEDPIMNIHVHEIIYPHDLVISCENNIVTITAEPVGEVTIEYRFNYEGEYITYTGPFPITETVMVTARATTEDGSINRSQQCEYVNPIDYSIPFYIENISGSTNTVQIKKDNNSAPTLTIQKSTDGTTWESMGTTSTTAITATIPANGKLYLRCSTNAWGTSYYCNTINTTGNCNAGGNIMSLLYGSGFTGKETTFRSDYNFRGLFMDNTHLVDVSDLILPATRLTKYCYFTMFRGCTSLTTAPELPATTLPIECYSQMFYGCTSLTTAPELPATTLTRNCCAHMFYNCTSLTTAPSILPATTLADSCYSNMFQGCTLLTAAPELPATTLASSCYSFMFYNCTSLTTAPELPATTLANSCYGDMFYGCTKLNYIKCLATNISTTGDTSYWVSGVAKSGTFVKNPSMTSWTTGVNGIPEGWVVKNSSGIALSQSLNVATIEMTELDEGTGYYTINGGSQVSIGEGTTTIPITQAMDGQTLLVHGEFDGVVNENSLIIKYNANAIPFYIENISGSTNTVQIKKNNSSAPTLTIQKSTDGTTWESMGTTSTTAITSTIPANGKLYLRCSANVWGASSYNAYNRISTTGNCNVGGNIMSLLYGSNFTGNETTFPSGSSYNFRGLFNSNTHIVDASDLILPATTLAQSCYVDMFQGCTSLTTAPALQATTLANYCYSDMFGGCTSLTAAPELPATTLAQSCYNGMFQGCTSLTTAPALQATTLANYCYSDMFLGCTSLTTAPELPATTLAERCYSSMFKGCTSLTSAPALPATTLAQYCYEYMFQGCTRLTTAPALPATTLAQYCYEYMFQGCTRLTTAPALPATTLAQYCYYYMFNGCTSLTTAPELPATTLATQCYKSMFYNCTSLTTAPSTLPATTLTNYCYGSMFYGCTSLTAAPSLPATTLANNCYSYMFNGCTNLNYIKCLATNKSASGCTYSWVSGVASTGTFVKNADMSASTWGIGANGIPSGWTVKNSSGIALSQSLNVATIEMTDLDEGTGYYTINGGSQVSIGEGTTTIPITQAMDGQTLSVHGEFDGEATQETMTLDWVDYSPAITITESNNYVTINAPNANTIQYRLGSTGEYTNYTTPVYINEDTTIYVTATRTVSGVDYTSTASQEVQHVLIPPSNLNITCSNNFVSINATGAATLEYNLDGGSTYTTYTVPFFISQSGTVYAKATNSDGSITKSQAVTYVDYRPTITITENNNYVTINAPNANTIQYRLGSTGEYTNYTTPVYIASDTTIYVTATRTVSGVDYTSTASKDVEHVLIPPTNLVISCVNNKVTITATNAATIEYNFDGGSTYTTYTQPFEISETVTVYAKATNADGSITGSQECVYDGYIDHLISMGCKFWAPLDENDITEKLSETAPTHRAGQLTWDSTKNAYKFKTTSGGQQVLVYSITNVNNVSSTLAYTLIADVWCISHNGTMDFYTCGQAATSDGSVACSTGETHRFTGFTNGSWHKLVQTVNGNTLKMYIDGSCVRTSTSTSYGYSLRPNCWTAASVRNYTTIGNVWNSYYFEGYIKNVYLFDHELTSSEINSLQYR